PELLTEKKERFKEKHKLAEDLARDLSKSGKHKLFEDFVSRFGNIKPAFIAEVMISLPKTLRRKYKADDSKLTDADFEGIFKKLDSGEITKDSVEEILLAICQGKPINYAKYAPLSDEELEKEIKDILKESAGLEFRAVMGKAMGTLKGRAEGKKIVDMLKKLQK
ncbi:hypothetical protein ACFL3V_04160, partial [Nanoarchaeota archaeon]